VRSQRRIIRRRKIAFTSTLAVLATAASALLYYAGDLAGLLSKGSDSPPLAAPTPLRGAALSTAPLIVDAPDDSFIWPDEPAARQLTRLDQSTSTAKAESNPVSRPDAADDRQSDDPAIAAARRQLADGKTIEARHALNALLKQKLSKSDQAEVRNLLTKLADDTVFSKRKLPDDPLVDTYTVKSGDVLVRIGREYKVPAEALMRINGIKDASKLRAEEKIKVAKGPFHVRIYKSEFRMDVYLQDLYVRSYRVGLGADQGTPEGVWRVKERLDNPTYFPSASAQEKRVISADDPKNPLGERWIGLEGIEGDALGRSGYGIHGTIDPDSIGKAVSLGCVRMHNEDVEFLFDLMQTGQSTVTILP
jgi:LysM repeat protein